MRFAVGDWVDWLDRNNWFYLKGVRDKKPYITSAYITPQGNVVFVREFQDDKGILLPIKVFGEDDYE